MLSQRLTLGPVLIALLIAGVWLDEWLAGRLMPEFLHTPWRDSWPPGMVVFWAVMALSVGASLELVRLLRRKGVTASRWLTTAFAVAGVLLSGLMPTGASGVAGAAGMGTGVALVLVVSLVYYSRDERSEGMMAAAGGALLAFAYLGVMLGFVVLLRREHSAWVVLWVVLTTKSCDIGAYFTGRAFGRRKLAPWLSPGKTWEGLVGGVIVAAAVGGGGALAVRAWADPTGSAPGWLLGVVLGMVFAVVGQMGDLLASLLKRDAGAKDAGQSLPGFGGVIDVIDSPVLVAPVAFWLLKLATQPLPA